MKVVYLALALFLLGCTTNPTHKNNVYYTDKRLEQTYSQEGITPHKLLKSFQQNYSAELRERGVEGVVIIHDINKEGKAENVRVLFSRPAKIFDQGAIDAAYKWRFEPAKKDGKPVTAKNIVMNTVFCSPEVQIYEHKEPLCDNKEEALKELKKSLVIPERQYEP